jgi:hypothetical protein
MAEIINISASQGRLSPCRATSATTALSEAQSRLQPIGERAGTGELLACLTLVAPSGLSANDRDEWVRVAKMTLTGIPGDLLQRGCKLARETCRFPSEIVPLIMAEAKDAWARRKRDLAHEMAREENRNAPRLEQHDPEYVDPAEVRKLIASIGQ